MNTINKAIFCDRDGIINVDKGYVCQINAFEFTDGIFELCFKLQQLGYKLFVVTNQSGIGRGYYTLEDFLSITKYVDTEFNQHKIQILKTYYCPHAPEENCICRKPNPTMVLEAIREYHLDATQSWFIGDKESDIESALGAGVTNTILVSAHPNGTKAKYVVDKIRDIIPIIKV